MMTCLKYMSIASAHTAVAHPGVLHAYYSWNLDSRRRTRVRPERGFLPVGRDGCAIRHIATPRRRHSSQTSGANGTGHVSYGETGPARACAWCVGAYLVYEILSAPNCCGQARSLLRIAALRR